MKTFLNGVEYKAYREIMREVGVRFGCINFSYIFFRTPKFKIEECSFLDEIMVVPGDMTIHELDEYKQFLNAHYEYLDFALAPTFSVLGGCKVQAIPHFEEQVNLPIGYISFKDSQKPFLKIRIKRAIENGVTIHGDQVDWPFLSSRNSSTWMRGAAGLMSDFRNGKLDVGFTQYPSTIARRLLEQGYDINLKLVKKNNWEELAKINCIAWKIQQDLEV
jgi:hypothetical protein